MKHLQSIGCITWLCLLPTVSYTVVVQYRPGDSVWLWGDIANLLHKVLFRLLLPTMHCALFHLLPSVHNVIRFAYAQQMNHARVQVEANKWPRVVWSAAEFEWAFTQLTSQNKLFYPRKQTRALLNWPKQLGCECTLQNRLSPWYSHRLLLIISSERR